MLAPMVTFSSLPNGEISPDEIPYLEARARGGFDWIITGACCVHPGGWAFQGQWQCSDARYVPSLRSAAEAIHRGGSQAILQIHHGGRQAPSSLCGQPVSASAIPSDRPNAETPRALTVDEIEEIVEAFVAAARRAEEAGFDGVEIHGANGYLLQQFVSPHSNRREDAYGSDRCKFSEEVATRVLEALGGRLVVGYRFSPEELETPGIRMPDTLALLDRLAPLGLDYVHASLDRFDRPSLHDDRSAPILRQVSDHLNGQVPLVVAGEVRTWTDCDRALSLGAHSVAIGRMGILNPDWPIRARSGQELRTALPREGAQERLTLPKGLADKAAQVPAWFAVEPA